jgi:hypothetical protein
MVKDLGGQIGDVARLIPIEEAAQRHSDMTDIPVHRPRHEVLQVAHQVIIGGRPVPWLLAWMPALLLAFAHL